MKAYFKLFSNSFVDVDELTPAFIVIALKDGSKYGVAFSSSTEQETVVGLREAIGARISAYSKEVKDAKEVLDIITYNMMFISDQPEYTYDSWDEASNYAETYLKSFSYATQAWKYELFDPIYPTNDNKTKEK